MKKKGGGEWEKGMGRKRGVEREGGRKAAVSVTGRAAAERLFCVGPRPRPADRRRCAGADCDRAGPGARAR